jgi:hypothetical protein
MKKKLKPTAAPKPCPTPDEFQAYLEKFYDLHQKEWHSELLEPAPEWIYLLGLHLRLVELEQLELAVPELLS